MKSRTLEEIIRAEQSHRHEGGQFGINACKESIRFSVEYLGENLADLLNEYVERANADAFFNKAMVLACWELMQEAEAEAETMTNETKKAEIMAIVDRLCADNSTDCRGLSLSGVASDLLDAVGIDPYLDIFEIPVHSDRQVCVCFWFNGEPFELWAGLSYDTKDFFTECRRWSEDANGEIVDFSIFAETEEEPTETEATEEDKTMKNYISRRGEDADRINAVIEAYEATRDGKTADTVNRLVETMGRTGAAVAVATVVNAVSLHDGRISDRTREWAQSVDLAPSNEQLRALGIYGVDSWMHSAHVDNLGAAMRRWLRDNPQPEIIGEEPTEEASADPVEVFNEAHNSIIEDKSGNRSAWGRGVTAYALELLDSIEEAIKGGWLPLDELETAKGRKAAMLNGASDWDQFSWGGCSLIYDSDIAERLCTPSELKRTRGGELRPNSREEWLDTQARALNQAANRASRALRQALEKRA